MPYRDLFPCLDLLDALAYALECLARLLDQIVHTLPNACSISACPQMTDLRAQARNVSSKREQLVHQILRQPLELRVVRVVGSVAPRLRLEAGKLLERHGCSSLFLE